MTIEYLLDTNICIFLLKDAYDLRDRVTQIGLAKFAVSEITIAELFYGASKSICKEERLEDVAKIMKKFIVLPIFPSLSVYGDLRVNLESKGSRIDDFDLLIGSSAIVNNLTLVTDNVKHLGRLPGLKIENWVLR